jgi:hypothetical protein
MSGLAGVAYRPLNQEPRRVRANGRSTREDVRRLSGSSPPYRAWTLPLSSCLPPSMRARAVEAAVESESSGHPSAALRPHKRGAHRQSGRRSPVGSDSHTFGHPAGRAKSCQNSDAEPDSHGHTGITHLNDFDRPKHLFLTAGWRGRFQAGYAGSIPVTRSLCFRPWSGARLGDSPTPNAVMPRWCRIGRS